MKLKTLFIFAFILILPSLTKAQIKGYVNPSATYCEKMGYTYENRTDSLGNSNGVCILPNDSVVDAWDFFRGKVATEYSWCEKMGYRTENVISTENGFISDCAVCIQNSKQVGEIRTPMTELMEQKGDPLISTPEKKSSNVFYEKAKINSNLKEAGAIPESFDWRSYNGHSYIGAVRNQGSCGSCYSFGANACAEGVYNFANSLYDANCIDLSESFIAWCLGSISPYSSHFSGCDGADYDYQELQALCDSGVCLESSFPYVQTSPGTCTHWNDSRVKFNDWYRVDCSDTTTIKTAIMNYGVVDAAVYVAGTFDSYSGGIYTDANTACGGSPCYNTTTNHAIALVGWGHDATQGLYWILRNSWGSSWGESGYMRIKWNAARVACEVCYMEYILPDENAPTGFIATPVSQSEIDLSWNLNSNSDPVLVAWSSTDTFGDPIDGNSYFPGNSISGGGTVLYYGSSTGYSHTSLTTATTYYYRAWSNTSGTYSTGVVQNATTSCGKISTFPYTEDFENSGNIPNCWTQEQVNGSGINWTFLKGNGSSNPSTAHSGNLNACLKDGTSADNKTRLISPPIDLKNTINTTLSFWHTQALWSTDQDKLTVYYKTSISGTWTQLATYTLSITTWTKETLSLTDVTSDYYICFEGNAKWGYGVCIDDVSITAENSVYPNLTVTHVSLGNGEYDCWNALENVTVAGPTFSVELLSGSDANFIAGESINFLQGFNAHQGSQMHAYITETGDYCNSIVASPIQTPLAEKSALINGETKPATLGFTEKQVKVYPNPNNGRFVVELTNFEGVSEISIINTSGAVISKTMAKNNKTEFDQLTLQKGLYFVTIKNGETITSRKIVVQ